MKKLQSSVRNTFMLVCLTIFSTLSAIAQDGSGSIYDVEDKKVVFNVYSKSFPIIVFGVVAIILGYLGYRYWKDNMADDSTHTPHHQ